MVAAGKNLFGGFKHLFQGIYLVALWTAPRKIRNKISWKTCSEYIGAHACYRTRVEHGIDSTFGMVGHDEAAELQARFAESLSCIIPQFYFGVVIFQVRVIAVGA